MQPYFKKCKKSLSIALKCQQKIALTVLAINTSSNFPVPKALHMELAVEKKIIIPFKIRVFFLLLWAVSVHICNGMKIYNGSIQHQ